MKKDDDQKAFLAPESRENLVGLSDVERRMRAAIDSGRAPHAWIIAGPKGAGKSTLAFRFARALLDPTALSKDGTLFISKEAKVFRHVASASHADLFVARREWDEKKKRLPSEISVDVIRRITEFFSLTSAFGGRRVAIVDAADEMNRNAANALLKILEEPPPGGVLILVSHALGALPPTIRSRCVVAKTRAHDKAEVASFLKDEGAATSDAEADELAVLGDCLPGRAVRLSTQGGVGVLKAAQSYCAAARKGDWAGVRNAVETFSKPGAADEYALWRDMVLNETAEAALDASSGASTLPAATALAETWTRLHEMFERESAVNLDRRHVMLDAAHILHKATPNL